MTTSFNIPRGSSKVKATTVPIPKGLGSQVRAKALAENITLKMLATKFNIPYDTLRHIVNGEQAMAKPKVIEKLTNYIKSSEALTTQ
jgi:predicted transcriptional regulator